MLDVDQQLARLRERIQAIDHKFEKTKPLTGAQAAIRLPASPVEDCTDGKVIANSFGEHFQVDKFFASHQTHGSADIGALSELPDTLLDALSENEILSIAPERWAFLDTETTGLAGGSGTYAFLIGVGQITSRGFSIRQYFMREYAEERSVLLALEEHLAGFDVVITYNGRGYDQPLLETRYRMNRHKPPFSRLHHLDLLFGARRLWKLQLEGCRLVQLEREILGFQREDDVPGELIPYVYFDYLRSRNAGRLKSVFHHNALDILSLACLTAIVPAAFRSTDAEALTRIGVRKGPELAGLGRWLRTAGECEKSLALLKRAVDAGLPDSLLFRTLWDIACLEKQLRRPAEALGVFVDLTSCRNEYRIAALKELAKYYEHQEKNYALALDFTEQALSLERSTELLHRKARLERRLDRPRSRPLPMRFVG